MKREKHKLSVPVRKRRRRWLINPLTRVHRERGYRRGKQKEEDKKVIKEEVKQ